MRSFEDLRAEVYRRGEEKKAKIKKARRRTLALCVPLALCVAAVCFIQAQPLMYAANDSAENGKSQMTEAVMEDSLVCSSILMEVKGYGGDTWKSDDQNVIVEVSNALYAITGTQTEIYSSVNDSWQYTADAMVPDGYQIIFTDREGDRVTYFLSEEYLEVIATGQRFLLTEAEYTKLKMMIAP